MALICLPLHESIVRLELAPQFLQLVLHHLVPMLFSPNLFLEGLYLFVTTCWLPEIVNPGLYHVIIGNQTKGKESMNRTLKLRKEKVMMKHKGKNKLQLLKTHTSMK